MPKGGWALMFDDTRQLVDRMSAVSQALSCKSTTDQPKPSQDRTLKPVWVACPLPRAPRSGGCRAGEGVYRRLSAALSRPATNRCSIIAATARQRTKPPIFGEPPLNSGQYCQSASQVPVFIPSYTRGGFDGFLLSIAVHYGLR